MKKQFNNVSLVSIDKKEGRVSESSTRKGATRFNSNGQKIAPVIILRTNVPIPADWDKLINPDPDHRRSDTFDAVLGLEIANSLAESSNAVDWPTLKSLVSLGDARVSFQAESYSKGDQLYDSRGKAIEGRVHLEDGVKYNNVEVTLSPDAVFQSQVTSRVAAQMAKMFSGMSGIGSRASNPAHQEEPVAKKQAIFPNE